MADCVCGNPEGSNKECERCRLLKTIDDLRAEVIQLGLIITEVAASGIEHTSEGKYHCVQISFALWEEIADWGDSAMYDDPDVSPEEQKRNDAMERGDYLRDRAKDEQAERKQR